ncbi:MAG: hypothetical protein AB1466_04235 [Actinomycetota bacterium]
MRLVSVDNTLKEDQKANIDKSQGKEKPATLKRDSSGSLEQEQNKYVQQCYPTVNYERKPD